MKKIILFVFILFGLLGCGVSNKMSDILLYDHDILVSIKEGTLTNQGATFIIENNSDRVLRYGEGYSLEKKESNSWYEIDAGKKVIHPILFELGVDNGVELDIQWEYNYGVLESGEYRWIKKVSFEKEDGTFDDFYIGVEFSI